MRSPLRQLFIILLLGSALPTRALSVMDCGTRPPTIAEIWEQADAVVYGTSTRIQTDASKHRSKTYDSTFYVERCWKGGLDGYIQVEGEYESDFGPLRRFEIHRTYLALLKKLPNRAAYTPESIIPLQLPLGSDPSPGNAENAANPFALDGVKQPQPHHNEYLLEILEFAERKVGNEAEVKRIHDLRVGIAEERVREQERAAKVATQKAKEDADFLAAASLEFETARKTESLANRKRMLLSLKLRLKERFNDGAQELEGKIIAKLSVIDTLLANGIQTSRPTGP